MNTPPDFAAADSPSGAASGIRPFAEIGNYIPVHRICFDVIMPSLSPNAWKILCLVLRKTKGWGKESDGISYSQLMQGTGIKNQTTVRNAIMELRGMKQHRMLQNGVTKGKQWARDETMPVYLLTHYPDNFDKPNSYSLNRDVVIPIPLPATADQSDTLL